MKKIIFKTKIKDFESTGKERITIQLRRYNQKGIYDKKSEDRANFTIHLLDCDIEKAWPIIINALMQSQYIDNSFEVEE